MAEQHTPEPWHAIKLDLSFDETNERFIEVEGRFIIVDATRFWVLAGVENNDGHGEANARRIVACVNACADIPTEALESGAIEAFIQAAEDLLAADAYHNADLTVLMEAWRTLFPDQTEARNG